MFISWTLSRFSAGPWERAEKRLGVQANMFRAENLFAFLEVKMKEGSEIILNHICTHQHSAKRLLGFLRWLVAVLWRDECVLQMMK